MEHSEAWELIKFLKALTWGVIAICVCELIIIGVMGYFLYDGQFEYTETKTQELEDVENSTASIE